MGGAALIKRLKSSYSITCDYVLIKADCRLYSGLTMYCHIVCAVYVLELKKSIGLAIIGLSDILASSRALVISANIKQLGFKDHNAEKRWSDLY